MSAGPAHRPARRSQRCCDQGEPPQRLRARRRPEHSPDWQRGAIEVPANRHIPAKPREQVDDAYIGTPTSRIDGREGHGRRQVCRRVQRPRPRPRRAWSARRLPRAASRASTPARPWPSTGVLDVLTHENRPPLADNDQAYKDDVAPDGSPYRPLYDGKIMFDGQPIALVVAETSEIARFAASLVKVDYDKQAHVTDMFRQRDAAVPVKATHQSHGGRLRAAEAARHARQGAGGGRRAPRGRVLRSDRAPQPDGALRLDGGLRARWQAHGLRQDPGRAERAKVSVRRVRHEAGGRARHVAVHGRRIRLGPAPAVPGGAGSAGGARAEAFGAARADASADVCAGLPAGDDPAHRARRKYRGNPRCDHPRCGDRYLAIRRLPSAGNRLVRRCSTSRPTPNTRTGWPSSTSRHLATCARRAPPPRCSPSSRRWTSLRSS